MKVGLEPIVQRPRIMSTKPRFNETYTEKFDNVMFNKRVVRGNTYARMMADKNPIFINTQGKFQKKK